MGESPPQEYSTKAPRAPRVDYNEVKKYAGNASYQKMQAELDHTEVTNSREVYHKENR